MASRLKLHEELKEILGNDNVYFQPPASVRLKYPCIVYKFTTGNTDYADDNPYIFSRRYQITLIDRDPDNLFADKIAMAFKTIRMSTNFSTDGLNHYVYELYY